MAESHQEQQTECHHLILTNHYFHTQNLSVKNGENNGLLAGVPFLTSSRAQIPSSNSLPLLTPVPRRLPDKSSPC